MTDQIVLKLTKEIQSGLKTEAQVLYVLAEIRKILERDDHLRKPEYEYLVFHCDWVLHAALDRRSARKIIEHFDEVHALGLEKKDPSPDNEAQRISKLEPFRDEISAFLRQYAIPDFSQSSDQWAKFIYLYSRIIEDCPLRIRADNPVLVSEIVVAVRESRETIVPGEHFFKVSWHVKDKNGKSGSFFVIHSFEA
jgi:hypothetical protein